MVSRTGAGAVAASQDHRLSAHGWMYLARASASSSRKDHFDAGLLIRLRTCDIGHPLSRQIPAPRIPYHIHWVMHLTVQPTTSTSLSCPSARRPKTRIPIPSRQTLVATGTAAQVRHRMEL